MHPKSVVLYQLPFKSSVSQSIKTFMHDVIDKYFRCRRVAQLVSALLSVLEVPSSILSGYNVCSEFSQIFIDVALNTGKMEHRHREELKGATVNSIDNSSMN